MVRRDIVAQLVLPWAVALVVGCGGGSSGAAAGGGVDAGVSDAAEADEPSEPADVAVSDLGEDEVGDAGGALTEDARSEVCEQVWRQLGGFEMFAFEASRPDATAQAAGEDGASVCSREGVLPWTEVSWVEAAEACESIGARLCTGAEWDGGCRGEGRAIFPYGQDYDPEACNVLESPDGCFNACRLVTTGQYERCVSASGVHDMSGNAAEWVADRRPFGDEAYDVRGGSYFSADDNTIRCRNANLSREPTFTNPDLGFRCCR